MTNDMSSLILCILDGRRSGAFLAVNVVAGQQPGLRATAVTLRAKVVPDRRAAQAQAPRAG